MKSLAVRKSFFALYLLAIGLLVGVELAIGLLAAPVIFFPVGFLGENMLSHFQSGVLMTQIFLRFNVLLMLCTLFMLCYEIYLFSKSRDFISIVLMFIVLVGSLAFVLYFTTYIVEAQQAGAYATSTQEFKDIHKQSETVLKIVLLGQIGLFFRRIWTETR